MALAESGVEVEVICGEDQYAPIGSEGILDPSTRGVRIRKIPSIVPGKDIQSGKVHRQLWFCFAALQLLLIRRRPHVFVAQTTPPLIVMMVAAVAPMRRRPLVLIAMNLSPEVLFAHGLVNSESRFGRLLATAFDWACRRASRLVALGTIMRSRPVSHGVAKDRVVIISNWATGDESVVRRQDNRLVGEWGMVGRTVVLYSGNIGVAHDVETPILAYEKARQQCPELRLVFVGKGTRLPDAKRLAREQGLEGAIDFRPLVPMEGLPESIGVTAVALVTFRSGFEVFVVPSKLLGYMAGGIPTVFVGPESDAQTILEESGRVAFSPGDVDALADSVVRCVEDRSFLEGMGQAAQQYYLESLSRDVALDKYRRLIAHVRSRGASCPTT